MGGLSKALQEREESVNAQLEESSKNAFGDEFRNYEDSKRQDIVQKTYYEMHTYQTVEFGQSQREEWLKFDKVSTL